MWTEINLIMELNLRFYAIDHINIVSVSTVVDVTYNTYCSHIHKSSETEVYERRKYC